MTVIATPPAPAAEPVPARRPPEEKNLNKAGWFTYLALGVVVLLWVLPTIGLLSHPIE